MTTNTECPIGNSNAAFVHGINDALNDGMNTFKMFSACKCEVCQKSYRDGVWGAAMVDEHECEKTILRLLERIREMERQLAEATRPSSPPVVDATFSTVDAMCERCGWGPHIVTSVGALDIQVCQKCNIGRANQ